MHTRWIETEWDNTVEPFTGGDPIEEEDTIPRQTVVVEVGGRRLEVSLPGDLAHRQRRRRGRRRRCHPQEAQAPQARRARRCAPRPATR